MLSRDDYLTDWAALHGGYDPRDNALVRWWLSLTYVVARPLARTRVAPDAVTGLAVLVSAAGAAVAGAGGRWELAAALVVVGSGLLDNVDGAVAVLTSRATRWGFVLDSLADRVSDSAYLLALWLAGAPGWLCVGGGLLMFLQEYARARATAGGLSDVGVVTVWERPTRVIVTAVFLLCTGLFLDGVWAELGAGAWVGLGPVGLVQLLVVVRRRLGDER
ncbi:MAG: CDP-alcohol phosphatidyltransferase family protein [Actinomycetes bacterium]